MPATVEQQHCRLALGEARIAEDSEILETILGSCVAGVFWSRRLRVGAMCHGALPRCPLTVSRSSNVAVSLRYVDFAMRYLVDAMRARGVSLAEMDIKLFGGADVLLLPSEPEASVGNQNCLAALETLVDLGLKPSASDLRGAPGRVIYFNSRTGRVLRRRLPASGVGDKHTTGIANWTDWMSESREIAP